MHIILGSMLHDIEIYILLTCLLNGSDSCNFLVVLKPKTLIVDFQNKQSTLYLFGILFQRSFLHFFSYDVVIIES